ncbi:hypothetical protein B0T25DRAFT_105567 [Lasiosphaeria hispida]|uniref:Uncharacterized protein n=1 Tax=Lasiosphaeria hispida TaxID=260671 RepID=A0AAJ0HR24_9PEZI|nr:hypothetical protein B0T25DRAFT_105567 [Lasiosphaeria hispida]
MLNCLFQSARKLLSDKRVDSSWRCHTALADAPESFSKPFTPESYRETRGSAENIRRLAPSLPTQCRGPSCAPPEERGGGGGDGHRGPATPYFPSQRRIPYPGVELPSLSQAFVPRGSEAGRPATRRRHGILSPCKSYLSPVGFGPPTSPFFESNMGLSMAVPRGPLVRSSWDSVIQNKWRSRAKTFCLAASCRRPRYMPREKSFHKTEYIDRKACSLLPSALGEHFSTQWRVGFYHTTLRKAPPASHGAPFTWGARWCMASPACYWTPPGRHLLCKNREPCRENGVGRPRPQ